jgi:hypothetical protein
MMPSSQHRSPSTSYRFLTRVTGRTLPPLDKVLRLRCTLNAADHSVVGLSTLVVELGTAADCDRRLELVHEPTGSDAAPPKYFELVASLAPAGAPASRVRGLFRASAASDGTEYRIAGIMDPAQSEIALPEIVLRGELG